MVINTYEVPVCLYIYLVSAYKPRCYLYMTIAPYAYLHVTGWQMMLRCQLCLLQLLHRNDTDYLRLDLVSSRVCRANLSCYTCPHISCEICGYLMFTYRLDLDNLPSFANYICILVLNSDPHACRCDQNMFFYNCYTFKQILIIVLNKMPSF